MTADPIWIGRFRVSGAAAAAVLVCTHGVTAFYTVRVLFSESTGAGSRDSFSVIGRGEWQLRYFCAFALYGEMIIFRLDRLRLGKTANKFAFALGLHTLRRTSLRLDRRRLGKTK